MENQMIERGNILGKQIRYLQSWKGTQVDTAKSRKVLLKLYGDDIRAFKLNDLVTFVGILESKSFKDDEVDAQGDSQMTTENEPEKTEEGEEDGEEEEENYVEMDEMFANLVPN